MFTTIVITISDSLNPAKISVACRPGHPIAPMREVLLPLPEGALAPRRRCASTFPSAARRPSSEHPQIRHEPPAGCSAQRQPPAPESPPSSASRTSAAYLEVAQNPMAGPQPRHEPLLRRNPPTAFTVASITPPASPRPLPHAPPRPSLPESSREQQRQAVSREKSRHTPAPRRCVNTASARGIENRPQPSRSITWVPMHLREPHTGSAGKPHRPPLSRRRFLSHRPGQISHMAPPS